MATVGMDAPNDGIRWSYEMGSRPPSNAPAGHGTTPISAGTMNPHAMPTPRLDHAVRHPPTTSQRFDCLIRRKHTAQSE